MKTAADTLQFLQARISMIDEYTERTGHETTSDRETRRALADIVEFMTGERP